MDSYKSFYLSTNTAHGYKSLFEKACTPDSNSRIYIVKGASSKIRSRFIKDISESLLKEGFYYEQIVCSYDKNKVEGVIFEDLNVCIFDGNYKNKLDPMFCECTQYIINLGEICKRNELFLKRDEIIPLYNSAKESSKKCNKFLVAAVSMQEDISRIVGKSVSADKLEKFVNRFAKKEFGCIGDKVGNTSLRFLSAIGSDGYTTQFDTIKNMCARIFVLEDKANCVSDTFISQIKDCALMCGYDIILCVEPISSNKSEHIIIPELSLGIFTSNGLHQWDGEYTKKINSSRFTDRDTIKNHKTRIKFNLDAINELISQSCIHLENMKKTIDTIDAIYDKFSNTDDIDSYVFSTKEDILSLVDMQ